MDSASNIIDEFIKRGKKAKELSEAGSDSDGEHGVPNKKSNNRVLGNFALFPSDFGMREVGNDSSDGGGDEVREPDEVVILDDKIR